MNVYFISGLGADERLFQRLSLPATYTIHHIEWPALSENETLQSYCIKISKRIDTSKEFAIVGFSFGGIIATELSFMLHPVHTIIISSICTRKELPLQLKICAMLRLNQLVPTTSLNKIYPFTYWYLGIKEENGKHLLKQVINDEKPKFLKWAIHEILNWKNESRPHNLFHLHGAEDRLFPLHFTQPDKVINNGGHLIIYTHANEVNKIMEEQLRLHQIRQQHTEAEG